MERTQISIDTWFGKTVRVAHDDERLYVEDGLESYSAPLRDITSIRRTSTAVNERRYWEIELVVEGTTRVVSFRPNSTIWNWSFRTFLGIMETLSPDCVKSRSWLGF